MVVSCPFLYSWAQHGWGAPLELGVRNSPDLGLNWILALVQPLIKFALCMLTGHMPHGRRDPGGKLKSTPENPSGSTMLGINLPCFKARHGQFFWFLVIVCLSRSWLACKGGAQSTCTFAHCTYSVVRCSTERYMEAVAVRISGSNLPSHIRWGEHVHHRPVLTTTLLKISSLSLFGQVCVTEVVCFKWMHSGRSCIETCLPEVFPLL